MKSIKTKITLAFVIIITIMAVLIVAVVIVNFSLLNKYKIINENIVYEQELRDNILGLIEESYKSFNANDYSLYNAKLDEFRSIERKLDSRFADPSIDKEAKLAYRSVKNSVNMVINQIESIKIEKENIEAITGLSDSFQKSIERFEFVKQNISDLLIVETKNIAKVTQDIQKQQALLALYIGIIVLFSTFLLLIFSLVFSKKITDPIISLSDAAKKISEGDLSLTIKEKLLQGEDEMGSLSRSFNLMIMKLREKILAFEDSNSKLDEKVKEISKNNLELENNKVVIMNLLEDLEKEKSNAENLVIIRTKELSDEKARLLASINSLKMGFAVIGAEGGVIINNPSLHDILGEKGDINSLDTINTHLKIEGETLFEGLKRCTKDRCIVEIKEITLGVKYLRLFLNPVFSLAGIPIGGVLILEDITEEKILERSRDEFFAVASHELRTPLTAIRGNAEMILEEYKDKVSDSEVREMLGDINEASTRLIGIVNDFLEASRVEQGNIVFNKTNFNIIEESEKVVSTLRAEAEKKNVVLELIKPEGGLPEVSADKAKINEVLFNLVGNALKFTDKGSIKVSFEVIDKSMKVRVTDTGRGIMIKNESLLFRKFQPAGDVLAREFTKSTGLGLYISKKLIDKMDGTIGLEKTEIGVGSTFFFAIPLAS